MIERPLRTIVFDDGDGASRVKHPSRGAFEFDIQLVGEDRFTGEDGENVLAVVAKPRDLAGDNLELAGGLVEDTRSKKLAVSVLDNVTSGRHLREGSVFWMGEIFPENKMKGSRIRPFGLWRW